MKRLFVSHDKKMVYNEIPKAASTSIKDFLGIPKNPVLGVDYFTTYSSIQEIIKSENYVYFTFVRNPYHRFISSFYECKRRGTIKPNISIIDFVFHIKRNGFKIDTHVVPQVDYILHHADLKILKLEEIKSFLGEDVLNLNTTPIEQEKRTLLKAQISVLNNFQELYKRDLHLYNNL